MNSLLKLVCLVFLTVAVSSSVQGQYDESIDPNMPVTTIEVPEPSYNFGEVKEGVTVSHKYTIKNTGNQPLKIFNVKPSCGCTTPDWTKEEIQPGGEGFVWIEFNSNNKTGIQKKSVTVTMNTEPRIKVLNFSGEVVMEDGMGLIPDEDDGHGHSHGNYDVQDIKIESASAEETAEREKLDRVIDSLKKVISSIEPSAPDQNSAAIDPTTASPIPSPVSEDIWEPEVEPNLPLTHVSWDEDNHDFGKIKAGNKVTHFYWFTNTGDQPLKVLNVKPACGCTTPDWSKEEIAPGKKGFVKVEFDSANKTGIQKKSVTVTMNTDPRSKVLNFSGEVHD